MDYQASKSSSKIATKNLFLKTTTVGTFLLFCLFGYAAAQATNPLTADIVITAVVPQSPLTYPDTPPSPPGPVNMVDTTDSAVFRGIAYPGSVVSILKNGVVVAESPANPDGTFEVRVGNLTQGTYSFGIRAEDNAHLKSRLLTFSIFVTQGIITVVDNIFLPPTITSDKVEVKLGDPIVFSGRAAPSSEVRISLSSSFEILKRTVSNTEGYWTYSLNSTDIGLGDFSAKSRTLTNDNLSPYSDEITFRVGDTSRLRAKLTELSGFRRRCDLNDDGRVNILDFSIMAFWYKRLGFPARVDLSSDGRINLTDLSILAYCWTG